MINLKGTYYLDWHITRVANTPFRHTVRSFVGKPDISILEIGCLEGQSTEWWLQVVATHPTSKVYCVDPHPDHAQGGKKRRPTNKTIYEVFKENILDTYSKDKVEYTRDTSSNYLRSLPVQPTFDIAYVDGAHRSKDTLEDLILLWPMMKKGGLVMCDDYAWVYPKEVPMHNRPIFGIQAFLQCFEGEYDLEHLGYYASFFKK